jgi:hypothetical protein
MWFNSLGNALDEMVPVLLRRVRRSSREAGRDAVGLFGADETDARVEASSTAGFDKVVHGKK